ncbi:MAG: prepilin peptidase [Verrucomicrobia bacterium]|nr:prepilin peptidase [Verrucomicrobiota bacterium]
MFDAARWAAAPFHLWSVVFLVLGAVVGSFLNVCIHRWPRGQSIVSPPSHCPACGKAIPWYLNIPLVTWVWLRGRCAFCAAPIPVRYVAVEGLTGLSFLGCWLVYGRVSAPLALLYCLLLAGLIAATFIDAEHFIIPDQITIGGVVAGVLGSFLVPELHRVESSVTALQRCAWGAAVGAGIVYGIVRLGKLLLGRHKLRLPPGTRVYFDEEYLVLPGEAIAYGELFYRKGDAVILQAQQVELVDRCYWNVPIRLTRETLVIGELEFSTEEVPCFEAVTDAMTLPREAMGLGDVKFMAAIGAFLGWAGVLFSLLASALVGSIVGLTLIALGRRDRSTPLPYGPYIALAAAGWVFLGDRILRWWLGGP